MGHGPVVAEVVGKMCYVKKLFLKISQDLQENTCTRVSLLLLALLKNNSISCLLANLDKFFRIAMLSTACNSPS